MEGGSARHKGWTRAALNTGQHKQNNSTQTTIPQAGFEFTILEFEWEKTIYALDRSGTVIGNCSFQATEI
jgi:hypothetical protein